MRVCQFRHGGIWMVVDSNHRSKLQQIYSLSPSATRETIHNGLTSSDYCITESIKNQAVFFGRAIIFSFFSSSFFHPDITL